MKHLLPAVLILLIPLQTPAQSRGDLVSDTLLMALDKPAILDIYALFDLPEPLFKIDFEEVEVHRIVYYTLNGRGDSLTLASGLITVPVNSTCEFPIVNYNHGSLAYDETLSELMAKLNQHYIGVPMAANGYVTALPDLLGYGATPVEHPHPYIHAKSEATAVVDMLRATRQFCEGYNVALNDQLFLLGYSQGGHTTMAAHRELQENHSDEFTVTASAPCSGPYDVSGMMYDSLLQSNTFSNPFFIAFVTLSYQYVYQNLYTDISEIFQSPYDSLILRMLNRDNPESGLRDSLPVPGVQMFQPDYLLEIISDPGHPYREDLRDNDLYNWAPLAPVRLYYCTEDEQVPYANALFTTDTMTSLGADIMAINAGPYDHFECTPFALIGAKLWFDQYREPCMVPVAEALEITPVLFPNPVTSAFEIRLPFSGQGEIRVTDQLGRMVHVVRVEGQAQCRIPLDHQPAGLYHVEIRLDNRLWQQPVIKL